MELIPTSLQCISGIASAFGVALAAIILVVFITKFFDGVASGEDVE